jgi:hypothetical protein
MPVIAVTTTTTTVTAADDDDGGSSDGGGDGCAVATSVAVDTSVAIATTAAATAVVDTPTVVVPFANPIAVAVIDNTLPKTEGWGRGGDMVDVNNIQG